MSGPEVKKAMRVFGLAVVFGVTAQPVPAGERALVNTTHSDNARMRMVDMGDVRWGHGFWGERFEVVHETMVPHMWTLLSDKQLSHAWANFQVAADIEPGRDGRMAHHGAPFNDGDFYKWFESLVTVYAAKPEPALEERMEMIIDAIAKAQREDGYLHTPTIIAQRYGDKPAEAFEERMDFETYNMGHLMTAAALHHRVTGKDSLLNVAEKVCDFLYDYYRNASPQLARSAICPSHYMGVVEMYRTTAEERYLELAQQLIELRGMVENGTAHNQDRVPFREMDEAEGHAVRANYLYAGVADVAAETGDRTLMEPLEAIWRDVVGQKMAVTGHTGALYDGAWPYGSTNHGLVQKVHQAYGYDYQLPNLTAYNETCATVGHVLWSWRMFLNTGEARFADVVERALYNGVLPAVSLEGKDYLYVNPLRKVEEDELTVELRWSRTRQPYYGSFCCPPNIVRTLAQVSNYVYSLSEDTLWINLYDASELDTRWREGGRIRVRQETEYPWDGRVKLTIDDAPERPISVKLRIPGWADEARVKVNGRAVAGTPTPGSYFDVRGAWAGGDVIELDIPMRAKMLEAHPHVEAAVNQVAVKRGPLVYCLEGDDLPGDLHINDVVLPLDAELRPRPERIVNTDLRVLETQLLALEREAWSAGELYREVSRAEPRQIEAKLVPYYAWGNREAKQMTVWLPVR